MTQPSDTLPKTAPTWQPRLPNTGKPRYLELADAIKADIDRGVLAPGDRLPPQRRVAQDLGVDFSTVSRGYAEAVRLGHIESFVGRGTFVRDPKADTPRADPRRAQEEDPMMNMPPEPEDPGLVQQMQQGLTHVAANLVPLLRYQSVTGSLQDKEMAARWIEENGFEADLDRLAVVPGAHASFQAILSVIAEPGLVVLCEDLTYPGIRAVAAQLGLRLIGVPSDTDGICPEALEQLITTHWPAALYLNPTLQNPTTDTIPPARRAAIAAVLERYDTQLIEDDAYCFVASDAPTPIASLIPHLTWHVAGLSKCFGAGLRLAYTTVPDRALLGKFTQALRSGHVMASPLSLALMSRWIEDGTATALQGFVRHEARARQDLARDLLRGADLRQAPEAFNLWLTLPEGTSRAEVMARMAHRQIGIMPSDAFTLSAPPAEALRVCLGGPIKRAQLHEELIALNDTIQRKDWIG